MDRQQLSVKLVTDDMKQHFYLSRKLL